MGASLQAAAAEYADRGWRVFPVGPDKTPLTEHGFHDATTSIFKFDWDKASGIGLAVPDDVVVVDVDPRNGGDESMDVLEENGCVVQVTTLRASTAGGGKHFYFQYKGDKLKGKLAPGIDVKLPGRGYTILPPSFGGAYRWDVETDIAPLPECVYDRLKRGPGAVIDEGFRVGTSYGERAAQGELARVMGAPEGERNNTLNSAAFAIGQLVAGGELGPMAVERLRTVAERTGLDPDEVDATLDSGYQAGLREPRSAPEKPPTQSETRGRFKLYTPENIGPPRKFLYDPFLIERTLTWLWGPSGGGKSMVLDYVITKLSQSGVFCLLYDWESPELEIERLSNMGADSRYYRLQGMDPEFPADFGTDWFRPAVERDIEDTGAKLVVFNTFTAMYAEQAAADGWNAPVRQAGSVARDIAEKGPAVVITDHQEDPKATKAHGGSSKKAWSDLYLRVIQDGDEKWKPGQPYHFLMENLKPSREYVPTIRGTVRGGKGFDGPLWITWDIL